MSYRLSIMIDRQQTDRFKNSTSNQDALQQIMAAVQNNPAAGWGQMSVSGASYGTSLFPQWMSDAIAANIPGIKYDDLNFQFYADFETVQEAQQGSLWLQQFKVWAMQNNQLSAEHRDIAKGLDSRIMDAGYVPDLGGQDISKMEF